MDHARRRGGRGVGRPVPRARWRRRGSTIAGGRREGPAPRAWRIRTPSSRPPTRRFAALPADECAGLTLGRFIDALDAPGDGRDAVRMRLQGTNAIDLGRVALRVVGGPEAFAAPAGHVPPDDARQPVAAGRDRRLVARRASRTSDPVRHARPRRGRGPGGGGPRRQRGRRRRGAPRARGRRAAIRTHGSPTTSGTRSVSCRWDRRPSWRWPSTDRRSRERCRARSCRSGAGWPTEATASHGGA